MISDETKLSMLGGVLAFILTQAIMAIDYSLMTPVLAICLTIAVTSMLHKTCWLFVDFVIAIMTFMAIGCTISVLRIVGIVLL
jgi:hypothetical protein